ncbi:MAG: flagellar biosynthesis protein FlhB [Dethiosulfovibrio sp.]|nr:flagellar biosynthesis protein FlhB [Dethiosulfovibrio sp.]
MIEALGLQFFAQEKTEPATPRKRQKEREEGRVAKSQDLGAGVVIISGLLMLLLFGGWIFDGLSSFTKELVFFMGDKALWQDGWFNVISVKSIEVYAVYLFPLALACFLAAFFISVVQVGFFISSKPLIPKMDRFNPISGLKKIVSLRSLVEMLKGLLKALILAVMLYSALTGDLEEMVAYIRYPLGDAVPLLLWKIWMLSFKMTLLLLVIALFDWSYQKWEFEKNIRMSKQEIKEEYKQMEGDPQIKQKIRQKQREMAQKRMMADVPKADVVITNPTTLAIAIKYEKGKMEAPVVLAKGKDRVAEKIRDIAQEHKIPIVENKPLAWALYEVVDVGEAIPERLYKGVAEVLAFVYGLRGKGRGK